MNLKWKCGVQTNLVVVGCLWEGGFSPTGLCQIILDLERFCKPLNSAPLLHSPRFEHWAYYIHYDTSSWFNISETLTAYLSLMPLGSWTLDLIDRVNHFKVWASDLRPPVLFWLGAYTYPTSFLTAVLQATVLPLLHTRRVILSTLLPLTSHDSTLVFCFFFHYRFSYFINSNFRRIVPGPFA